MRMGRPMGVRFSLRGLMPRQWHTVQKRSATLTGRLMMSLPAALTQLVDQRCERRIRLLAQRPRAIEVVLMRIPAVQLHFDKRDAGFDKAPGKQTTLAEGVAAIAIAHGRRLLRQIEGAELRAA